MCKYSNVQMCECANGEMCGCANECCRELIAELIYL